jgi:hypothetical protein
MLRALQDKCDAGPAWVLGRLSSKQWHVDDVLAPIQYGLEGGGMEKADARKLVKKFVEDRPLTESVLTAMAILTAALYGGEDSGQADEGERQPAEA